MTPELWERIERHWDAVSDLRGEALDAYLSNLDDELGRALGAMLRHADGDFLESPVAADAPEGPDRLVGQQLGAYRIIEPVGEGGMGRVYRAERRDAFRKQVAIKVMRGWPGPRRVRQFQDERQILADIEHPAIARLLDGGTSADGLPYVVMEFVEGLPLTEHCARHGLGIERRLRLFQTLCAAVGHAHRHLVVHRDLKPSNILVTEDGDLRLLDFGVAKLLGEPGPDPASPRRNVNASGPGIDGTAPRAAATAGVQGLTPAYASPEQLAGGTVTTASDLYSLGILLHELLTGQRPANADSAVAAPKPPSVALEDDPPPALASSRDQLRRRLRGDLDAIVVRATQPNPQDRYHSAEELAEDLERHLTSRPVLARPPKRAYRLRKLVQRHPVAAPLVALLAASTLGLGIVASLQARSAVRERDEARHQRQGAEEVSRFLEETFQISDPQAGGAEGVRARELLNRASERLDERFASRPELEARFRNALARIYQNLGLYSEARRHFDLALAQRSELLGARHLDVAETEIDLAWLLTQQGDYSAAAERIETAMEIRRALRAPDDAQAARAHENRGLVRLAQGEYAGAEDDHRIALGIRRRLFGDDHALVAESLRNLAEGVGYQGRRREALALAEKALRRVRSGEGADATAEANVLFVRGDQHFFLAEYTRAVEDYTSSLEIYRRFVSPGHPSLGILLNNRARALRRLGNLEGAEADYREALASARRGLGEEHREVATVLINLTVVLRDRGRFAEADAAAARALGLITRLQGDGNPAVGVFGSNRAANLLAWGKLDAAEAHYQTARDTLLPSLGEQHPRVVDTLAGLARVQHRRGRWGEALEKLARAIELYSGDGAPQETKLAQFHLELGDIHLDAGDPEAAETAFRLALETAGDSPFGQLLRARVLVRLAEALHRSTANPGDQDAAGAEVQGTARRAVAAVTNIRPDDHWQVALIRLRALALGTDGLTDRPVDLALGDLGVLVAARGEGSTPAYRGLLWAARVLERSGDPRASGLRRRAEELDARRRALEAVPAQPLPRPPLPHDAAASIGLRNAAPIHRELPR
ncbi:MAG: tetratricopeptide repeat protein [Acidobacteriota bacterium]